MIKATALKPVTDENRNLVADVLTKRSQNIKIEYSQNAELVPPAVENLACKMLHLDAEIRGLLNNLRGFYVTKQEDFHLSLRGLSKEAKSSIIDLFESLYGVMSEIRYCADCDVINGKLIFSRCLLPASTWKSPSARPSRMSSRNWKRSIRSSLSFMQTQRWRLLTAG